MIKIGDYNTLKVVREKKIGYFLDGGTGESVDDILLPYNNTKGQKLQEGEEIEVFIYRDSKDRMVATLEKPLAKVGDIAYLKVAAVTNIGCFLEVGLDRDILVPLKEKLYNLEKGKSYLFYIYLDKTGRIAATTYIEKHLQNGDLYKVGDIVKGTVYGFQTNKTAMVAVDNLYRGIVLHNEYFNKLNYGDTLELRVNKIYEEGKLGLTPRKAAKEELPLIQETILSYLREHNGFMPFNDKSSPEDIYSAFNVSKNYFKNALGGLMKKNLITQDSKGTKLK
ncbi:CvfB family protein [Clostridium polynesiense]|uniref:CvfB family protein n=1 Tax=Clostridium polynesiense TaxID=1325933 RepID=UPI00058BDDFF|nr:S1-like domain-containing RNA-binding protein [Clostridium polynesiense]